jgi:uncharacterized protein YsxB (DUF464 family)
MIKVKVSGYNERLYFEAVGHAQGEQDGDKVCAAISILMLSAAHRLKEMESNGDFYFSEITVENGYALFDIEPREDSRERVEEIVEILCAGITLLEENYPELVALT